jgi:hypothetical protein
VRLTLHTLSHGLKKQFEMVAGHRNQVDEKLQQSKWVAGVLFCVGIDRNDISNLTLRFKSPRNLAEATIAPAKMLHARHIAEVRSAA